MDCKQEIKHCENAKKNTTQNLEQTLLRVLPKHYCTRFLSVCIFFDESGEVYIYMYRRPNRDVIILKQGHR